MKIELPHVRVNSNKKAPVVYEAFILLENGLFSGYSGEGDTPREAIEDAKKWIPIVEENENRNRDNA